MCRVDMCMIRALGVASSTVLLVTSVVLLGGAQTLIDAHDAGMTIDAVSVVVVFLTVAAFVAAFPCTCTYVPATATRGVIHACGIAVLVGAALLQWATSRATLCEFDTSAYAHETNALHYAVIASLAAVLNVTMAVLVHAYVRRHTQQVVAIMRRRRAERARRAMPHIDGGTVSTNDDDDDDDDSLEDVTLDDETLEHVTIDSDVDDVIEMTTYN